MIKDLAWFFAYGTLRPGGSNFNYYLQGNIEDVYDNAVINGYDMYNRGAYPMVFPCNFGRATVIGTLMRIKKDKLASVIKKLDTLEGYNGPNATNHYERVVVPVNYLIQLEEAKLAPLTQVAWVYLGCERLRKEIVNSLAQSRLHHGDWRKHTVDKKDDITQEFPLNVFDGD